MACLTQALQGVSGASPTEIKKHIDTHYVGVSKSFLRNEPDIDSTLARLFAGGYVEVRYSSIMWLP